MNTKIFTKNELSEAAAMIRNGGIVVMPTETVYGLAANAFDAEAVEKIFKAKGRQADNPLIVHIANFSDWENLVEEIPPKARLLAERFWPGPLTIILKKKPTVPDIVSGGLDTVAVRMPKNIIAFKFIRECACPLAAPSANLSGSPSPTKFSHVLKDMNGRVDGIIEGSDCVVGLESTVISLAGDKPVILRPGRITAAQISKVIGDVEIHRAVTNNLSEGEQAPSPGMKYKHYAPKASVSIVDGNEQEYIKFIKENADDKTAVICFTEMLEQLKGYHTFSLGSGNDSIAHSKRLFDILRAIDDASLKKAYAPLPSSEGVGLAVNNRLLRAAGFNVIKLSSDEKRSLKAKKGQKNKKAKSKSKPEKNNDAEDDYDEVEFIDFGKKELSADVYDNYETETVAEANAQEAENSNIPPYDANNNSDSKPDSALKNKKLGDKKSESGDSTIEALSKLTLSSDLSADDDSPANNIVIEADENEKNPINMVSDIILKSDDTIEEVQSPVIEEAAHRTDYKKQKPGLFKSILFKRAQKTAYIPDAPGTYTTFETDENDNRISKEQSVAQTQVAKQKKPKNKKAREGKKEPSPKRAENVEQLKIIGVTGKTGAGKGFVIKSLAGSDKDARVIDADKVYHALLKKENMQISIIFAFGQRVVGDDGNIDRKKLAAIAFSSEENIKKLNKATHPYVVREIMMIIEHAKKNSIKTVYIDAPTLIESGLHKTCDEIIFVKSPKSVRKKRIIERDKLTEQEAEQRMRFEKDDKFYLKYANKVIEN